MDRMSRAAFQIIIAAMIAGALGFGIAVSVVPLDEIVEFRALINAGLGAISANNHPDDGNTEVEGPAAPPSKALTEPASPARGRQDANSGCDPRSTNCASGSPTKTATPSDIPNRDGATKNSRPSDTGGALQAPAPESKPARSPTLSPHGESEKAHAVPGSHSKLSRRKQS
jgi:hypothetical protein